MSAREIPPQFVPKIWGSRKLEPWFPNSSEKIGEVWFPAGELLVKFLFTTEKLSVQVHPKDGYARSMKTRGGRRRCGISCGPILERRSRWDFASQLNETRFPSFAGRAQ